MSCDTGCATDDYTLPSASPPPDTPKSENLVPLTWATKLQSTTPSNDAISLPSTRVRRISETSSNASSRLALHTVHAQSSLPLCSREFRNVITPKRKISNAITMQDHTYQPSRFLGIIPIFVFQSRAPDFRTKYSEKSSSWQLAFINPRRACARVTVLVNPRRACARVTVLVLSVCLSVCVSVCVFSLFSHLAQSGVQTAVSATSARYGHEI